MPSYPAEDIWNKSGLNGLPDVRLGDYREDEDLFPLGVEDMPLTELADNMQRAAGMVAWACTLLAGVEAHESYLKDQVAERRLRATVAYRREHSEDLAGSKLSADEVRQAAADSDPGLSELAEELRRVTAMQHRFERLLQAWQTIRDTYSRQITIRDLEKERR